MNETGIPKGNADAGRELYQNSFIIMGVLGGTGVVHFISHGLAHVMETSILAEAVIVIIIVPPVRGGDLCE